MFQRTDPQSGREDIAELLVNSAITRRDDSVACGNAAAAAGKSLTVAWFRARKRSRLLLRNQRIGIQGKNLTGPASFLTFPACATAELGPSPHAKSMTKAVRLTLREGGISLPEPTRRGAASPARAPRACP